MDTIKSLVQPLVGGYGSSSIVDGMKLVVLGGTVETARRVSSSAWSHFVNSFFLTAHFSEEDVPYDWLMLWLSRRPEWQRSREFETTTRASGPGGPSATSTNYSEEDRDWDAWEAVVNQNFPVSDGEDDEDGEGKPRTRIVFQPTYDTTHTIYYRSHWLRVRRGKRQDSGCEMLSISVVARSNAILKQLVLQAKKEYEAESVHRIQIYFADIHGSWRWTDSRHKRPLSSIVLNPGVKESLVEDTKDFLRSEKWYADRGIPFRRGYLLHGVPGSGKSSLIHALAGQLGLDIYVVSLSASWISDNTLMTLMGRVPARCVLLLEDLDAAFVRSTTREDGDEDGEGDDGENGGSGGAGGNESFPGFTSGFWSGNSSSSGGFSSSYGYSSSSRSRRSHRYRSDGLSDMNTLSLSGLLNALDGVAASEGRLLFATTNHLERLDPALSRPGRMDVWVEFRNASQWQAEALFRNFFPCEEEEEVVSSSSSSDDGEVDIEKNLSVLPAVPTTPTRDGGRHQTRRFVPSAAMARDLSVSSTTSERHPLPAPPSTSSLWSLSTSIASSASSLLSGYSSPISVASPSMSTPPPLPPTPPSPSPASTSQNPLSSGFGSSNTAYLPPPPVQSNKPKPLDKKTLATLAKKFADGVPEEEFSVASLQGYLLKHKAQPEAAANGVAAWAKSEKEMRERLQKEKEAREVREKALREKRRKEAQEKDKVKKEKEKKDKELETVKALLAEKEKEEELEKMRQQLKDKEEELRKKEEERKKEAEGKPADSAESQSEEESEDKKDEMEEDAIEDKSE